ncbi:hypothetical protein SAMN04488062_10547 [Flavobacterium omnivorum]|uniref:Uncharacterized protein n=1 Tax=Flavobacterium omnivorum TaxID=178355 RepID=A0A1G8AKT4_9FLAO|nr:hypothetical protein SAMN04488062_10547 [Flavobacterium omnivorum]
MCYTILNFWCLIFYLGFKKAYLVGVIFLSLSYCFSFVYFELLIPAVFIDEITIATSLFPSFLSISISSSNATSCFSILIISNRVSIKK